MQIKAITIALVTVAVLLAVSGSAPAGTSLHWTSKATPGYQHMYRTHGSPKAVCHKQSARVIRCVRMWSSTPPYGTLWARLLSTKRVRYVWRDSAGRVSVTRSRVLDKDWVA